jgi:hypothetical protein
MADTGYLQTDASNQDFYLSELNIDASSALATLIGSATSAFTADATVDIQTVTVATMRELFNFQSDSIDINDIVSQDLLYRVNWTDNSNNPLGIDIDNSGNVIAGNIDGVPSNQNMTYDYVRNLALRLFNTANGVDLFNNEESLRATLKANFNIALNEQLLALAALGSQTFDASSNPARSVMSQIINSDPGRLQDMSSNLVYNDEVDSEENPIKYYKVPFVAGDKVYFKVTVHAHENQHLVVSRQEQVPTRSYLLKLTLQA